MNVKKYRPLLETALLSAIAFIAHLFLMPFVVEDQSGFRYSIPFLYGFFSICSLVIILILIVIKQKKIDSVGNTFMLLTCIKMVLAYLLLHPILNSNHSNLKAEKANFFLVFAVFLAIETIVAIRMLNEAE